MSEDAAIRDADAGDAAERDQLVRQVGEIERARHLCVQATLARADVEQLRRYIYDAELDHSPTLAFPTDEVPPGKQTYAGQIIVCRTCGPALVWPCPVHLALHPDAGEVELSHLVRMRHQAHFVMCDCLGHSGTCCVATCDCHTLERAAADTERS